MEPIRDIDAQWLEMGFVAGLGVQVPKKERPKKVYNLGKQGVSLIPTEQQWVSFAIGLYLSFGDYASSWAQPIKVPFQDGSAYKSKGNYLSFEIGSAKAERGSTVVLPLYICNNRVDNRGYCSYKAHITFNSDNLIFKSISPSPSWTGSFEYQQNAGVLLVQGRSDVVSYEDAVLAYIEFEVGSEAPNKNIVYLNNESALITKTLGVEKYIFPKNLVNGEVIIEDAGGSSSDVESSEDTYVSPPIGDEDDFIGPDTDLRYDFTINLFPIGDVSGEGADLIITITTADGQKVQTSIPLEEGSHHYTGKLPIRLPSFAKGPYTIEYYVKPKNEEDLYYWFVDGVVYWEFESEIPREEVGELPVEPPHKSVFEHFILYDGFEIETIAPGPEPTPAVSDLELYEIMQLLDGFTVEQLKELSSEVIDALLVSDSAAVEHLVMVKKSETEDFLISDGLEIEWFI